jgi:hypothetical protein
MAILIGYLPYYNKQYTLREGPNSGQEETLLTF